jgi:hypothetical protein
MACDGNERDEGDLMTISWSRLRPDNDWLYCFEDGEPILDHYVMEHDERILIRLKKKLRPKSENVFLQPSHWLDSNDAEEEEMTREEEEEQPLPAQSQNADENVKSETKMRRIPENQDPLRFLELPSGGFRVCGNEILVRGCGERCENEIVPSTRILVENCVVMKSVAL